MASRRLEVVIAGNASDAVSALGQTERAVGQFDRTSVDLAEEIKRALQKMRAENRRR